MKKRKLNWALLSTARINERLIPEIRKSKNSKLMAVASRDIKKSENYAKKHNIQKAYGSYEDLLQDKDIDVVYISLPKEPEQEIDDYLYKDGRLEKLEELFTQSKLEMDEKFARRISVYNAPGLTEKQIVQELQDINLSLIHI